MRWGASSQASALDRKISPAFAAPYCDCGPGFQPEIEAMITTLPPPRAVRCGTAARIAPDRVKRFRSNVRSQSSGVDSSRLPPADAADVGHQQVDPAERRRARVDETLDLAGRGHVRHDGVDWNADACSSALRALQRLDGPSADTDGAPLHGEPSCDLSPNAAAGPGHQANLAAQPKIHTLPPLSVVRPGNPVAVVRSITRQAPPRRRSARSSGARAAPGTPHGSAPGRLRSRIRRAPWAPSASRSITVIASVLAGVRQASS